MDLRIQVRSWIEWSRTNLPGTGDIPKISGGDVEVPWGVALEDICVYKDPHELLDCVMKYLIPNPCDVATRFIALHLYYSLSTLEPEDIAGYLMEGEEEDDEEPLENALEKAIDLTTGLEEDFRLLVRHLKHEEVPADWRYIRWEILNSYTIKDMDRALELYNKTQHLGLLDPAELYLLRGQFRFLRVFGPKLDEGFDPLMWEPKNYSSTEFGLTLVLFLWGLKVIRPEIGLDVSSHEALMDAASDLEKALKRTPDLSPAYRSVLARCYFSIGRFNDAAVKYQEVLNTTVDPLGLAEIPDLRMMVYRSLAESFRLAGDQEREVKALKECAKEFPSAQGINKRLAEIYAAKADFLLAYEYLRQEVMLSPQLEQELGTRIALALGATHPLSKNESDFPHKILREDPKLAKLLHSVIGAFWRNFLTLEAQSREEWKAGVLDMYYIAESAPELRDRWCEDAAKHFAKT